jgi:hypothetical protein
MDRRHDHYRGGFVPLWDIVSTVIIFTPLAIMVAMTIDMTTETPENPATGLGALGLILACFGVLCLIRWINLCADPRHVRCPLTEAKFSAPIQKYERADRRLQRYWQMMHGTTVRLDFLRRCHRSDPS